jgi:hypothetical protein
MKQFLWGATAATFWVAGLYFSRFRELTGDRLFTFFAWSFHVLALNLVLLALIDPPSETRHYLYLMRLVSFALILVGIYDKNRRGNRPTPGG